MNMKLIPTLFLAVFAQTEGVVHAQDNSVYLEAKAPRRVALVIANPEYSKLSDVLSARKDAELMSNALTRMNFDVTTHKDGFVDSEDFEDRVFEPFLNKITKDDNVVIYYSGHGFGLGGFNYLASSIAKKNYSISEAAAENISVETIIASLLHKKPGHILFIYDACRDIPNFKVKRTAEDGKKVTERPKGAVKPARFRQAGHNFQIHFASGWGETAAEDGDETTPSQFTGVLLRHVEAKDRPYVDISNYVYGEMEDTFNRRPELFRNTRLNLHVDTTDEYVEVQKEIWLSVLDRADVKIVQQYVLYNRLSPFIASARRWLRDYRRNGRIAKTAFSRYSPEAVERIWEKASETGARYAIAAPRSQLAFARSLSSSTTLEEASDADLGVFEVDDIGDPGISLGTEQLARLYAAHPTIFVDVATPTYGAPTTMSDDVTSVPQNSELRVRGFLRNETGVWLATDFFDRASEEATAARYIRLPNDLNASPSFIGLPIAEISVGTHSDTTLLVDADMIERAISDLDEKNFTITWISIASSSESEAGTDEIVYEEYVRSVRALHARRTLKRLGVETGRISYKFAADDVAKDTLRIRIFGHRQQ